MVALPREPVPGLSGRSQRSATTRWRSATLVERLDSPAVRMLLDVGHAHVVADREGVDLTGFVEPVLDVVRLFHVHDNLGARRRDTAAGSRPAAARPAPPAGRGHASLGVGRAGAREHAAPLVMEIHPSHRPQRDSAVARRPRRRSSGGAAPSARRIS